jgi:hypothetical protein
MINGVRTASLKHLAHAYHTRLHIHYEVITNSGAESLKTDTLNSTHVSPKVSEKVTAIKGNRDVLP